MSKQYSAVTVFDADEPNKTISSDDLAFQDFSGSSIPAGTAYSSSGNIPQQQAQGRIGASLFDTDRDASRRASASGGGWFSIDAYSVYFDVETKTVLERCWKTMYPKEEYLEGVLGGQPDLYGPFWLPTTLIFVLFFSSSLSGALTAYLNSQSYSYDFTKLSLAVGLVYTYALAIPGLLWAVMRYWAGIDQRTIPEVINLYGYGLTVFVPVALASIPPIALLRFVCAVLAFSLSLGFLLRNLYPVLASAPSKAARILVLGIGFLHAVFVLVLWVEFLGVGGGVSGSNIPLLGGGGTEDVGDIPAPPGAKWASK